MIMSVPHNPKMASLMQGMMECEQTEGMTILEHGLSVARWFDDLHGHVVHGRVTRLDWRMPSWIDNPLLAAMCLPADVLKTYQVFHDCGKPRCIVFDDDGRRHFPDHARISESAWLESGGDPQVGRLIGMDMDIHLLKADGIDEFASRPEAVSLLLTGLAEIHSNAEMFGGRDSTSFKIKFKHIEKRGKQILARINHSAAEAA